MMDKYGTPQRVERAGPTQVVTSQPTKNCCQELIVEFRKLAAGSKNPVQTECACGNKIEVSRA